MIDLVQGGVATELKNTTASRFSILVILSWCRWIVWHGGEHG